MSNPFSKNRRRQDSESRPAHLVINYVGWIAVLSVVLAGILYWFGKDGGAALALANSCVTGMVGLLGQTKFQQSPQEVTGPNNGPVPVSSTNEEPQGDSS